MDLQPWRHERGPVAVFRLPHNGREEIYPEGEGPSFCDREPDEKRRPPSGVWLDLPVSMPQCLMLITDADGRVIAATVDGVQVRWRDLDVVVTAVEEYNDDCARLGIAAQPRALNEGEQLEDGAREA